MGLEAWAKFARPDETLDLTGAPPQVFDRHDPNAEKDHGSQTGALHRELLRRNSKFQYLARRWIATAEFRIAHAVSADYHPPQFHFPRCALDWLIAAPARLALTRVQLAAGRWFFGGRYSFGVIVAAQTLHPLAARVYLPRWAGLSGGLGFDLLARLPGWDYSISADWVWKFCADTTASPRRLEGTGFVRICELEAALVKTIRFEFRTGIGYSFLN